MTTTAVRERTIEADGRQYTYREVGDPALPALIAIHGLISHAGLWDEFAKQIGERRHVVAYDLRGHGGSDWADDYSQRGWIDDVQCVADALELDRFALIGHTMGARTAWMYAAEHPDRVERLVILDSSPFVPRNFPPAPGDGFATLDDAIAAAREERFANARETLFRSFAERSVAQRADGRWYWRCDPRLRSAPLEQPGFAAPVEEQWATLRQVACPVLLLTTARRQRSNEDETLSALRDGRHVELPGLGFAALLEAPEVVVDATSEFLA
jgi:pimeloyl-ACP methyl ester carboxylesterase